MMRILLIGFLCWKGSVLLKICEFYVGLMCLLDHGLCILV